MATERLLKRVLSASQATCKTNEINETESTKQKGRDKELSRRRNEKIVCRYYYYARIMRMRSDTIFARLEDDFDITPRRLADIVNQHSDEIVALTKGGVKAAELEKKYPSFNWHLKSF